MPKGGDFAAGVEVLEVDAVYTSVIAGVNYVRRHGGSSS
ncbi:hypothetical protein MPNT_20148 [Candidatus Methylacidithermus pantelleriae]|uniref:Uncharacterized protein n=1 Tax=Candidatus Methylacidithermus pantelleriae TaxID=2744239 RepID=A0A8J2BPE0_9BACT|nr:hypothetical protein MPNT_20148 [Candidatus Methylacidithermus pantelleriae]